MAKRGVFIGRFQPFHRGHLKAVKDMVGKVGELVIVVGSSQYSHTLDNPFTTGERLTMIRQAMEEEGVSPSKYWAVPVPDMHVHMVWVAQVIGYTPRFDVVYTNEPLTRRLFIEAGYNVEPIPLHKRDVYSANEIRERMFREENWEELVPRGVAEFIIEINGPERMRDLARTDKIWK